jgi:2-polyprenyl-6-methoxyphenol hydroxylase-like FAD-dependent oxidoreductase
MDIIKWRGVEPQIREHATDEEGIAFVGANGCPIATSRGTGRSDIQSFTSEYEIFRGALAKIFIEPIVERVKLIFNESVDQYEQGDEGVLVTFASQRKEIYDLLVAADGLRSKLRGSMLNKSPHEQIHEEGVHAVYFTVKKDLLQGSRLAKWHNMTGGRCVFLRPDPDPAGRTRANLLNFTESSHTKMKGRLNQALEK